MGRCGTDLRIPTAALKAMQDAEAPFHEQVLVVLTSDDLNRTLTQSDRITLALLCKRNNLLRYRKGGRIVAV